MSAIEAFRKLREEGLKKLGASDQTFTGPDLTEYALITPTRFSAPTGAINAINQEIKRLQNKANQTEQAEPATQIDILKKRIQSVYLLFRKRLLKQRLSSEEATAVLESYQQEMEEKRKKIRDYTAERYKNDPKAAETKYKTLCGWMEARYDIMLAQISQELFPDTADWKREPAPESLKKQNEWYTQHVNQANFKQYDTKCMTNEENRDDITAMFAALEDVEGVNEYIHTKKDSEIVATFLNGTKSKNGTILSTSIKSGIRYDIDNLKESKTPTSLLEPGGELSFSGLTDAGVTASHEYMHYTVNAMGEYVISELINSGKFPEGYPKEHPLFTYDIPSKGYTRSPGLCASFVEHLMYQDLQMEMKNLTGHGLKNVTRQTKDLKNMGVTKYATTTSGEMLAEVYAGLSSKKPETWTVPERALANVLKGGWKQYARWVAEFLQTDTGKEALQEYVELPLILVTMEEVTKQDHKKFNPLMIVYFQGTCDWTENLAEQNKQIIRDRIARMVHKARSVSDVKNKLNRLMDSAFLLQTLQLQDSKVYEDLLSKEEDYLKGALYKECPSSTEVKAAALENLFSKITKYVKENDGKREPFAYNLKELSTFIQGKQANQQKETVDLIKKWKPGNTPVVPPQKTILTEKKNSKGNIV